MPLVFVSQLESICTHFQQPVEHHRHCPGGGLESGALPKFVDCFCVTDTQCRELSAKDEEHIYHNLADHLPQFDMTYEV